MARTEPFGIDVSQHNDRVNIDLVTTYRPKIVYAWARTGISWAYKDTRFDYFRDVFEYRMGIWFGGYHVLYPDQSGQAQARNMVKIAGKELKGYACDVELVRGCSPAKIRQEMGNFCMEILNMGLDAWGYTSPLWANSYIIPSGAIAPDWFSKIKWWLAQYLRIVAEHPGPLSRMNGVATSDVYIHQTSSMFSGPDIGQPTGAPYFDGNRWLIGTPGGITPPPQPSTLEERVARLESFHVGQ